MHATSKTVMVVVAAVLLPIVILASFALSAFAALLIFLGVMERV